MIVMTGLFRPVCVNPFEHGSLESFDEILPALQPRGHRHIPPMAQRVPNVLYGVQVLRALGIINHNVHAELGQLFEWLFVA